MVAEITDVRVSLRNERQIGERNAIALEYYTLLNGNVLSPQSHQTIKQIDEELRMPTEACLSLDSNHVPRYLQPLLMTSNDLLHSLGKGFLR